MIRKYPIKGLSKPNSVTLEHGNHLFWADSVLTKEKFLELFNFCKNHWDKNNPYYAKIEFEKESSDGTPINATMIDFSLK